LLVRPGLRCARLRPAGAADRASRSECPKAWKMIAEHGERTLRDHCRSSRAHSGGWSMCGPRTSPSPGGLLSRGNDRGRLRVASHRCRPLTSACPRRFRCNYPALTHRDACGAGPGPKYVPNVSPTQQI
jgi:hypothetical protein